MNDNRNPITVDVRGVYELGSLLKYIAKNKVDGFWDNGRPCFRLDIGTSYGDGYHDRHAVGSLVSVTKKNGSIYAQINILAYIDGGSIRPIYLTYESEVTE